MTDDRVQPESVPGRRLRSLRHPPSVVCHLSLVLGGWALALALMPPARAQDAPAAKPGPPTLEDFEKDADKDGIPDGWYNLRDVERVEGGVVGPHCLRFKAERPSRAARISRGFAVDGRTTEALIIGLWVRTEDVRSGERLGEDAALLIDLLGDELKTVGRGMLGPWTHTIGSTWTRVAKRIPVPPTAHEAILSIGLLGATGLLEVDGLSIEPVARGGQATTELLLNGGFELGDPDPPEWTVESGARRSSPGLRSSACLELSKSGARALNGLGVGVRPFAQLEIALSARGSGLRAGGGAAGAVFFLDADGGLLPGLERGVPLFRWGGGFDWRREGREVPVPQGAVRAVLQFEKLDAPGSLRIDDVTVRAAPTPEAGTWTPYHIATDTQRWHPYEPAESIEVGSALDASFLLEAPAGKHGRVTARDGHLIFEDGTPARFFGVALLPWLAFSEPDRADALADRLARSGINLVRLGDLDVPLGPGRSLFDDARDDTKALDRVALAKFDHLVAALKERGIYVALELQTARRFRTEDVVAEPRRLPPGGGPAAAFDPAIRERALEAAKGLLGHVNPETKTALRDDPVVAWVALAGELSLFDLLDDPDALPPTQAAALRELAQRTRGGSGRRFWQATEAAQWSGLAKALHDFGLKAPLAGSSHWRREPEFGLAQAAPGLDLIDDRLYWSFPPFGSPERRSMLWYPEFAPAVGAAKKRKTDRPYVVGQWAAHTQGAWSLPYEAADLMLTARTADAEGWDALVRRAVFLHPRIWGAAVTGTGGGEDMLGIPESLSGQPQVFSLLPHAAALMLRGEAPPNTKPAGRAAPNRGPGVPGWDPQRGQLVLDTPWTQGLAGWSDGRPVDLEHLSVLLDSGYGVVVASPAEPVPIARARRLLITAVARAEPTDLLYVDEHRLAIAYPGRPPILMEPVRARVTWRRTGTIKAYALDSAGRRASPVELTKIPEGVQLEIDGRSPTLHWELVVE